MASIPGGCSGKKEKTHFVTKVVCDWISARGQYLKKKDDGGKILDRKKKTHWMSIVWTLCLGGVPDDDSDDEAGDCPD